MVAGVRVLKTKHESTRLKRSAAGRCSQPSSIVAKNVANFRFEGVNVVAQTSSLMFHGSSRGKGNRKRKQNGS